MSEVDEKSGPLTIIDSADSKKIRKKLNYSWSSERQLIADKELSTVCNTIEKKRLTGSVGDIVLADTSRCFHMGSRVEGNEELPNERLMLVFQFLSPFAFTYSPKNKGLLPLLKRSAGYPERDLKLLLEDV